MANGTYTYSGDPSSSPKDQVRFLANAKGTTPETGFLSDEEIQWILSEEPNPYFAAARVAESISSHFGSQKTKTVGPLTISGREQAQNYADLASRLRQQGASSAKGAGPVFTGQTFEIFAIGMHDIPPSGLTTSQSLLGELP